MKVRTSPTTNAIEERTAELAAVERRLRAEIDRRRRAEKALRDRLRFDELASAIASEIINPPNGDIDAVVEDSLRRIGGFFKVDVVFFGRLTKNGEVLPATRYWVSEYFEQQRLAEATLQRSYERLASRLLREGSLVWTKLDEFPDWPEELEFVVRLGLKAAAVVTVNTDDAYTDILGLGSVRPQRGWPADIVERLQFIGRVVNNAVHRKQAEESLQESEKRFRLIVDQAGDAFFFLDYEGRIFDVNQQACKSLGYSIKELLNMTIYDVDIEVKEKQHRLRFWEPLAPGQYITFEGVHRRKDGTTFPVEVRLGRLDLGEQRLLLALCRDITDRKQTEEKLRESEERYRSIVEASPSAILAHRNGRIIFANPAGAKMLGFSEPKEMVGLSTMDIVSPDSRQLVGERLKRLDDWKSNPPQELDLVRLDGTAIRVEGASVPFMLHGERTAIFIFQNITQRKLAEDALAKSERQLRLIADSLPVFISYIDNEQRYQFNNVGYEEMVGVPQEEMRGKPVRKILGEEAYQSIQHYVNRALEGKEVRHEMIWPAGSLPSSRYMSVAYVPHFDESGKVLGFFSLMQDITDQKQAEEELIRKREELGHITRVATMGELVASFAHELRQPLAAILSKAQAANRFLSGDSPDRDEVRDIIADIIADDKRAAEVIQKLRALLKKESSHKEPIEINKAIHDVLTLLRSDTIIKNVSIKTDIEKDVPLVLGDQIHLQQVLLNLIRNGIEAMSEVEPGERKLLIRTSRDRPEMLTVSVRDRGEGIRDEQIEQIFEPFYTTKKDGMGMGLSINRSIVEAHGGDIWAENNPDRGATFSFSLPVIKEGEVCTTPK